MTDSLIERLRSGKGTEYCLCGPLREKAADEIERLTEEQRAYRCLAKELMAEKGAVIERLTAKCRAANAKQYKARLELKQANAVVDAIQKFIDAQAEDKGLWCEAQYASEAYIQRGLRGCHAYIESVIKDGPRAALETDDE